jgi:hypothetical protein
MNVEALLGTLDGSGSDAEWAAIHELRTRSDLPELLFRQYAKSKLLGARASCVYHSVRYAATSGPALELGIAATRDRSKVVRYRAAMLLAVAQDRRAIAALQSMAEAYPASATDAAAAIAAIESGNPNRFVDRDNSGKTTLRIS